MKKENNVIQFPKEPSNRIHLRERQSNQKAMLALSILSVLMMSVFLNQWLTRPQDAMTQGRGIASFSPMNSMVDIKWEHEMARQLGQSGDLTTSKLAERPSLQDELIFGSLEGRYGMKVSDGRIQSIDYIGTDKPLIIPDRGFFLRRYRNAFATAFADVGPAVSTEQGQEVWNLLGDDQTIVGHALFRLDGEGRLTSLTISR